MSIGVTEVNSTLVTVDIRTTECVLVSGNHAGTEGCGNTDVERAVEQFDELQHLDPRETLLWP